jgi:malonate decarboxylase beta subunit
LSLPADAAARIAWIADGGSFVETEVAAASPHLARWGIAAKRGDGVRIGRARILGLPVTLIAQEASFLGGAVGERQGRAIARALRAAANEGSAGVLLLLESGGVRLHESLPALLALADVLRAVCDLSAAGTPSVALVLGSGCFGGMSVIASACDHVFIEAESRLGVSGPRVLETLRGSAEFNAADALAVGAIYGASARSRSACALLLPADAEAARTRIAEALSSPRNASHRLDELEARLAERLVAAAAAPTLPARNWRPQAPWQCADAAGWCWHWPQEKLWLLPPLAPGALGPGEALALGRALRRFTREAEDDARLLVIEATSGHESTRRAEALGLNEYLAWLALAHAEARAQGRRVVGVLAGDGVSAAFFANALQTQALYATDQARVKLMDARAMERVTGLPKAEIEALLEDDAVFGQPVRHLFEYGALAGLLPDLQPETLKAAARMS